MSEPGEDRGTRPLVMLSGEAVDPGGKGEEEGGSVLGHAGGGVTGHVTDRDAPLGSPAKIHRVVPHPTANNHSAFFELVNDPGRQ